MTTASRDLAIGIILLSQTIIGILGNFSLLYDYLFHFHTESRLRAANLIFKHLTVANSLLILSKGVPETMAAFGLKHFINDFGCKSLFYVQRVGRVMSISIICLLSVFQTIMISPMNSCWKDVKVKAPKYIGCIISICWIIYMMVNFIMLTYVAGQWSSKNITKKWDLGYCSAPGQDTITEVLMTVILVFPEVSLSVLMLWATGSTVLILYRHKQRVQHIHKNNVSPRFSAESRAIHSILVQISTFVSFFTLSSIFNILTSFLTNCSWWLVNISALLLMCFPAVSPFLLMNHDSTDFRFCFVWIKNRKSPNVTRNKYILCFHNIWLFIHSSASKTQHRILRRSSMSS